MTEREQRRIERVLTGFGWYFRKYMIAKISGDKNEENFWETRAMDYQRGVQRADPFGKWPIRFARVCRELEAEIMGGQGYDRILGEDQGKRDGEGCTGGGDHPASPRRRRRRDGYAAESGDDALRQAAYEYLEIIYDILGRR